MQSAEPRGCPLARKIIRVAPRRWLMRRGDAGLRECVGPPRAPVKPRTTGRSSPGSLLRVVARWGRAACKLQYEKRNVIIPGV
eukprot:7183276-Pyramimonas_sp.AAC.1